MRKFFAAACCVIVVLQLLIAVPLVVCIAFFSVASGESFVVPTQSYSPEYGTPVGYSPSPVCTSESCPPQLAVAPAYSAPMPASNSYAPAMPPTIADAPQATPWNPAPVTAPKYEDPSPAQHAAIAEVRERLGSPIDDAFGNPTPPADPIAAYASTPVGKPAAATVPQSAPDLTVPPPFPVAAATNPLADESPAVGPPADATIGTKPDAGSCKMNPIVTLVESLRVSAEHLYTLSQSLEADGNYGRADQLRKLARDIREEIQIISHEHLPTPAPASATVTAASFDPAVVPASHEVSAPPVAPTPFDTPRILIVEEDEAKLGIELP